MEQSSFRGGVGVTVKSLSLRKNNDHLENGYISISTTNQGLQIMEYSDIFNKGNNKDDYHFFFLNNGNGNSNSFPYKREFISRDLEDFSLIYEKHWISKIPIYACETRDLQMEVIVSHENLKFPIFVEFGNLIEKCLEQISSLPFNSNHVLLYRKTGRVFEGGDSLMSFDFGPSETPLLMAVIPESLLVVKVSIPDLSINSDEFYCIPDCLVADLYEMTFQRYPQLSESARHRFAFYHENQDYWVHMDKRLDSLGPSRGIRLSLRMRYRILRVKTPALDDRNLMIDNCILMRELCYHVTNSCQNDSPLAKLFQDPSTRNFLDGKQIIFNSPYDQLCISSIPYPVDINLPLDNCFARIYIDPESKISDSKDYLCDILGINGPFDLYHEMDQKLDEGKSFWGNNVKKFANLSVVGTPEETPQKEQPLDNKIEFDDDNSIKEATIDGLIGYLVKSPDVKFICRFLSVFASFLSARDLFAKLTSRYRTLRNKGESYESFHRKRVARQLAICSIVNIWIGFYPAYFEAPLASLLEDFVIKRVILQFPQVGRGLLENLRVAVNARIIQKGVFPHAIIVERQLDLCSLDLTVVAECLCIIDLELFKELTPYKDLLNQEWLRKDEKVVSAITGFFNRLVNLTVSSILERNQSTSTSERAQIIAWYVSLMEKLLEYRNFASLMAIYAALNKSYIVRLRDTFSQLSDKTQKKLEAFGTLLDPATQYVKYRKLLKKAPLPTIPYIGLYLRDLLAIDEGNPTFKEKRINYLKFNLIATIFEQIVRFQQSSYDTLKGRRREDILFYLRNMIIRSSEDDGVSKSLEDEERIFYAKSLAIEPRK